MHVMIACDKKRLTFVSDSFSWFEAFPISPSCQAIGRAPDLRLHPLLHIWLARPPIYIARKERIGHGAPPLIYIYWIIVNLHQPLSLTYEIGSCHAGYAIAWSFDLFLLRIFHYPRLDVCYSESSYLESSKVEHSLFRVVKPVLVEWMLPRLATAAAKDASFWMIFLFEPASFPQLPFMEQGALLKECEKIGEKFW